MWLNLIRVLLWCYVKHVCLTVNDPKMHPKVSRKPCWSTQEPSWVFLLNLAVPKLFATSGGPCV